MSNPRPERFPKRARLIHQRDFDRVFSSRRASGNDLLVIHAVRNGLPYSRLGLAVSRHVGPAVVRNRWKRWIREAFRKHQSTLPVGLDLVVRPKRGAQSEYAQVVSAILAMTRRLDRLLPPVPSLGVPVPPEKQTSLPEKKVESNDRFRPSADAP